MHTPLPAASLQAAYEDAGGRLVRNPHTVIQQQHESDALRSFLASISSPRLVKFTLEGGMLWQLPNGGMHQGLRQQLQQRLRLFCRLAVLVFQQILVTPVALLTCPAAAVVMQRFPAGLDQHDFRGLFGYKVSHPAGWLAAFM